MGLWINTQDSDIEWKSYRDDLILWRWTDREIHKKSRLILQQNQVAVVLHEARMAAIFTEPGRYDLDDVLEEEKEKGFLNRSWSQEKVDILFISTRDFTIKWGTRNPILLRTDRYPEGIPIRAYGFYTVRVDDYLTFMNETSGQAYMFTTEEMKQKIELLLDRFLLQQFTEAGKKGCDLLNLQEKSEALANEIGENLDMELRRSGIAMTGFHIQGLSYPEGIQRVQVQEQMRRQEETGRRQPESEGMNFCPACGSRLQPGARFCSNCGRRL